MTYYSERVHHYTEESTELEVGDIYTPELSCKLSQNKQLLEFLLSIRGPRFQKKGAMNVAELHKIHCYYFTSKNMLKNIRIYTTLFY